MSEENVETIRRGYTQWTAAGEIRAHPDLVWDVTNLGWPEQQIYDGPAGAMQFMAEWADAWDNWEMEAEEYIDAGERVVVIVNQRGRWKATGIPVEMRFGQVWTLRTDKRSGCSCTRTRTRPSKPWGCRCSRCPYPRLPLAP